MSNTNSGSSLGFGGLLTLLFIALKLTNVIAWSWWWVLSPAWIPVVLFLVAFPIVFLVLALTDKK